MLPFYVQETPHFVYGLALEYYYGDRAIILKAMGRGFGATQSQLESAINEAYVTAETAGMQSSELKDLTPKIVDSIRGNVKKKLRYAE
ncbi:hypothetical protein CEXT_233501 [Caerostris extrusa]|uniref:Uncharacterized protein n=1 Tax=Caerostris extrusa TaxID=172846 RepID=A0AAV4TJ18_CAEEX|nr:hypothetical protein CEXT_233501 [Caerostris extrusa]